MPLNPHLPPNPHLNNRPSSSRYSSIPASSSLSDPRLRKSVKLPAKENEQRDDDYNNFIQEAFKVR